MFLKAIRIYIFSIPTVPKIIKLKNFFYLVNLGLCKTSCVSQTRRCEHRQRNCKPSDAEPETPSHFYREVIMHSHFSS